jgi:hypothetical protein
VVALTVPAAVHVRRGLLVALAPFTLIGCPSNTDHVDPTSVPSATASAPIEPPKRPARVLVDLVDALPGCDLDHLGPLVDAGSDALAQRLGWSTGAIGYTNVEHDGATWARIGDKKLSITFHLTASTRAFVSGRFVGHVAKSASVTIDDQPLGTLTFGREQIKIAKTETTTLPLDAGVHVVTLRFPGRARDGDAFADLDWLRIGVPDDGSSTYGPPTLRDVVLPAAAIAGVPHRALGLRAPGSARCLMRVPSRAVLRTSVGLLGAGEGDAEVRVLRDGKPPEVINSTHLESKDGNHWTDLEIPLGSFAREPMALELRALAAPSGGRVMFGDPAVVVKTPPKPTQPPARLALVVVLDGVERAELPPWSPVPTPHLAALTELAQAGATFDRHRAPTTVVSAALATMLTGLAPTVHGMADPNARLSTATTTLATIARDASLRTAMFTGVPYTFRAFGFANAWEKFVELSPSTGDPATAPIDAASQWITDLAKASSDARMLVVVHARGGHPPWDVTSKELAAAAPTDYSGIIDPRRAAQSLAHMRKKKARQNLSDADRVRIRSLETIALAAQDRALGQLIAALKTANLWDATLLIVTGDVAAGADPNVLFADGLDPTEPLLALPLYAHFPGGALAGVRAAEGSELADVTRTVLTALALDTAKHASNTTGRDLAVIASDDELGAGPPLVATLDARYAIRWGDLVLRGKLPAAPTLCDLSLDPTCAFNRRDVTPIASLAIFRHLARAEAALKGPVPTREPATLDPETAAALSVWGAIE